MSAFTSFYRSLTRHRLFALLNIGGLALGIAVFLVLLLYVRYETSYDRVLPGWDRLWILEEQYTRPDYPSDPNPYTMGGELEQLKGDFPELKGTRINLNSVNVKQGSAVVSEDVAAVDTGFFSLFPYPAVSGDPGGTIADPDGLVLTQTAARRYFGDLDPIGRTLTLAIGDKSFVYRVGAVLKDPPENMTFRAPFFVQLEHDRYSSEWWYHWGSTSLQTVLSFPDADAARAFEAKLPGFLARHAYPGGNVTKDTFRQFLAPLPSLHLASAADRGIVTTLGIVGALTLLIAIVNYVNLATARSGLRAREVAVRKVLGGTRRALVAQFLSEAIATVALAALIGLALAELALPGINALGGTHLRIDYLGMDGVLLPLLALTLVVGCLAGLYPAFLLSGFRPAAVLASARAPGGGRAGTRLRAGLVIVQFAIAIAFAIATAVMLSQTAHLASADIGFRREGLIDVTSLADSSLPLDRQRAMIEALGRVPGVVSIASGLNAPGAQNTTNSDTLNRPETPTRAPSISMVDIGPGYFETVQPRLVAGRLFDRAHGEDDTATMRDKDGRGSPDRRGVFNVVLNETAAQRLGFASPQAAIGQSLTGSGPLRVIGVVADLRFESPRESRRPTAYVFRSTPITAGFAIVRYAGEDARPVIAALETAWKGIAPDVPFGAKTAATVLYERFYKVDAQRSRLFTIGAMLAVLIGCIGLYGLAAFDTSRRVKEIGIRKTLGASTGDVLRLLIGQFLRPVLLANLIAWPIAFYAMQRWLGGFDDRIALSPLFFLAASLIALAIATGTVFGQAWRVARAEPARALRHE